MSFIGIDKHLLNAVKDGNIERAKAALKAGANVDGSRVLPCAPLLAATIANHVGMVDLLLRQSADPDTPITEELPHPCPSPDYAVAIPGERALHLAARSGNVEIVRLLLKRSHADPNATDNKGCTPLMATCRSSYVYTKVVRLLLEAGADPALANENGLLPLHVAAFRGHIDLVDMLHAGAPATLNRFNFCCQTPLFSACFNGHVGMASKLLSLGAMQPTSPYEIDTSPLLAALAKDFVDVAVVLIKEGEIRALGGWMLLPKALYMSVRLRQTGILRLLLTVYGEEGRSELANTYIKGTYLLHYGAAHCCPAAVSTLLESGADEEARDSEGRTARDALGLCCGWDMLRRDRGKGVAICRMLQRGPAYRARSWAWPCFSERDVGRSGDVSSGGDVSGSGDGDLAPTSPVFSSPPAVKTPPVMGMRIFRPEEESSSKFFVRLIGR